MMRLWGRSARATAKRRRSSSRRKPHARPPHPSRLAAEPVVTDDVNDASTQPILLSCNQAALPIKFWLLLARPLPGSSASLDLDRPPEL